MVRSVLLLLAILPAAAQAQTLNLPLGGALLYLARQAGYTLEYQGAVPELLRPVPVDLSRRGGLESLRGLLEEHMPGRYLLEELPGRLLRLSFRQTPGPGTGPSSPSPKHRVYFLFADGTLQEAEGSRPLRVSSVVQERASPKQESGTRALHLTLSPVEITCLEEAGQAVCLQPLFLAGEGVLDLDLPRGKLRLHYRVEPDPPVLRRYSLDGTTAPIPLAPAGGRGPVQ